MIHLDTSFLIRAMTPESPENRKLRAWIADDKTLGMKQKFDSNAGRTVYKVRNTIVEPLFGQNREYRGLRRFSFRLLQISYCR